MGTRARLKTRHYARKTVIQRSAHVPQTVLEGLNAEPHIDLRNRIWRFPAVAMFADVAGFTPMSEAMGTFGREGTEELTDVLNGYFEPTIELLQSYGGDVVHFGGDALTVVFPCEAAGSMSMIRRPSRSTRPVA